MTIQEKLKASGLTLTPSFNTGMQRRGAEWFSGKELDIGGVIVQVAFFGNWKNNTKEEWRSENCASTDTKKVQAELDLLLSEERAAREVFWLEVAKEAEEEWWLKATDRGTHPYIENKKLKSLHGARVFMSEGHPVLLVPMRDFSGKLWNVTRVYTKTFESPDGTKRGNKFVLKGGRKDGLFHLLGEIFPASKIYITEGFATGASVFEATGAPTVISFDAGNLKSVSALLREQYPEASLIFAADNDLFTKVKGRFYNTGREKALVAASLVRGDIILPKFTNLQLDSEPTDWNDLHVLAGLQEVTEQLNNPNRAIQEVVPLPTEGKGRNAKVSEKDLCAALLQHFDGKAMSFERNLFLYRDGFWNELSLDECDKVKQLIGRLAPGYGIRDIEAAFRYFLTFCPKPPTGVNLYQPLPGCANFTNGTLHVFKVGPTHKYEFHPHSKEDYLTSVLPFDFPGVPGEEIYKSVKNDLFDALLEAVWEGDEDKDQKKRAYKQVLGACLIPLFPIIVLFQGRPGSGKSTLLKMMRNLVSPKNISSVDPSDFHGFLMTDMIGKLLNINTDIDLVSPMKDSMVKKIIDRVPVQVNRKNRDTVQAYLPAIHAFAANKLPRTLDGESRAYERRMIIVKTEKYQPPENHDQDYDETVWNFCPEGVICAAVEGLFDLISSNGHYLRVDSGKLLVREMQDLNDPIALFLKDVEAGEVMDENTKVTLDPEARVARPILWECFKRWRDEQDRFTQGIGKIQFFRALEAKHYKIITINGIRYMKGIGSGAANSAQF